LGSPSTLDLAGQIPVPAAVLSKLPKLPKLGKGLEKLGEGVGRVWQKLFPNVSVPPNAGRTGPLWTSTSTKSGVENSLGHFKKHGVELPEYANATQYARGARDFVTNPPTGTLTKVRPNGDRLFYNQSTNTFGVQRSDGALRTMFKPDPAKHGFPTNLDYFNAQ
jgi:pyocin large subunit-like protein